jgi:ERCC4-related helicase
VFSKYRKLLELIQKTWKRRPTKEDRLVIFTERRETLAFLCENPTRDGDRYCNPASTVPLFSSAA